MDSEVDMAESPDQTKGVSPAYGSFKTFVSFANSIRDGGHVPMQIDRTLMGSLSGSGKSETMTALKFLGLAAGDKPVKPTVLFEQYVMAEDGERPAILRKILEDAYAFLLKAPEFDIERASTGQVADLFRQQGVAGSTVVKAISFFLSAAKEAGIKVSHNVKPPKVGSTGSKAKKEKRVDPIPDSVLAPPVLAAEKQPANTHRFEIPIPGKPSVSVIVPDAMDADDWEMLSQMFGIYVGRWKRYPNGSGSPADSGV
ncbi:hypothetical protein ACFVUR_13370 [Stenotrophomonas bentonitica]|uniref:hypothetical protein n=1 Tax=Stenotrophomonas bentonitica TaxID=1450134 RepID=UPI0036E40980